MAAKPIYWYGPGVLAGDIQPGEEITKKVPEATIKSLLDKGRAGFDKYAPSTRKTFDPVENLEAEVAKLRKQNQDLTADLAKANKAVEDLTGKLTSKE